MTAHPQRLVPSVRPEFERGVTDAGVIGDISRPLSAWERLTGNTLARRIFILVLLGAAWQGYAVWTQNPLMFPTLSETLATLWTSLVDGTLIERCVTSLRVLVVGYAAGIAAASVLTMLAVTTRFGNDLLSTLTSMFNPLPAIALLPLALLWFGLGEGSLTFVLVHAVLWPMALNTHSGFMGVSETLRMAGQNYGLKGLRYVLLILVPAALPSILTGLKIGWAFAWRTLIAAELVFGVSSGAGGIGWFIYENRNQLEIPSVFAGLLMVIIIGLLVESVVFRTLEIHTVRKWGMQR
ncbi:ABC transporter permease [Skermanella rosea]|uniref:ABC transporter permease n=1 Tax=Skermanella rosea TaxID=1817965 RepID=UPI0019313FDB|nr:ABC transporter permease [Skermanella rosea]UEM03107.1 ABC transporter permease [Skermanella rosea]